MDRRKFIMKSLACTAALLITENTMLAKKKTPHVTGYTANPDLETINPNWLGTPLDEDGLFVNHEHPWKPDYGQILKFMVERNPQRDFKRNDEWRIPLLKDDSWLSTPDDKIIWFGHASFFIQLDGTRILIDPVFGKLPVGKRFSELPIEPEKLLNIDYILVSHAHYDHCDKESLKLLTANNPRAQILTGLRLDKVIQKWASNPIHTAGWYQRYNLSDTLKVTFLPSRHWSNRSLFDTNESLWGGFMIQKAGKSIYYGGDSGYGSHFKEIGDLFQNINVSLIGAGAYAPTWFMGPNHQDPYHAVQAFHATRAKTFVPFHFGTFDSADEPLGEPAQILTKLKAEGKIENELRILKLGEVFNIL